MKEEKGNMQIILGMWGYSDFLNKNTLHSREKTNTICDTLVALIDLDMNNIWIFVWREKEKKVPVTLNKLDSLFADDWMESAQTKTTSVTPEFHPAQKL